MPLVEALDLQPDVVFDLDISANRPDALCMAGVARDLAAALGEPWSMPSEPAAPAPVDAALGTATVVVEAGDLCPRFTATILEGVPDGPSPVKLARRLTLAGMRPISAVVDVSNYVMLDLGQPNHAYDLDQLAGGGLLIRRGRPGERLVTLDEVERVLEPDDCVICDAEGTPVGVGGIMGGSRAEIGPGTRRVLLEAAWFSPMAVARTGARLGLHSEARVRFERGVDPEIAGAAVDRFVALLSTVAERRRSRSEAGAGSGPVRVGRVTLRRGPTVDVRSPSLPAPAVGPAAHRPGQRHPRHRPRRRRPWPDCSSRSASRCSPTGPGVPRSRIPSWRLDCEREIDVIEEVARTWGYGRIERTIPPGAPGGSGGLTDRQRQVRRLRDILAGAGYDEAWTTTFLAPGDLERAGLDPAAVEVENPLDRSESILRTELLPGLLKAVKFNVDRQAEDVALFEIGHVFALPQPPDITPDETERLAVIVAPAGPGRRRGAATGPWVDPGRRPPRPRVQTWRYLADALRLEAPTMVAARVPGLHPTRARPPHRRRRPAPGRGRRGRPGGGRGLRAAPAPRVSHPVGGRPPGRTPPALAGPEVSRFPASDIDLAFVVPDAVPAAAVQEHPGDRRRRRCSSGSGSSTCTAATSSGPGRRSLAFRLRFRAQDRTLDESRPGGSAPAGDRCGRRRPRSRRCGHERSGRYRSRWSWSGPGTSGISAATGAGTAARCAGAGSSGPTASTG